MFHGPGAPEAAYSDTLELDLATVEPSLAGPRRPQDRVPLHDARASFAAALKELQAARPAKKKAAGAALPIADGAAPTGRRRPWPMPRRERRDHEWLGRDRRDHELHQHLEPLGDDRRRPAGQEGRGAGLETKPWVKASLAPGSKVVTDYLADAGLDTYLDRLRFNLVGYGCTTCIGNSGPLPAAISEKINHDDLVAVAVLSGNRNFEGRINADVRANYLASPPLVVAYALAGTMDIDLQNDPLGHGDGGKPVYLRDIWPTQREIQDAIRKSVRSEMFQTEYAEVFEGDATLELAAGARRATSTSGIAASTYVKNPPYFDGMTTEPPPVAPIEGARVLALLGDSITTDHISPAGSIKPDGPAGRYLIERGVKPADFNSYGARRGNDEVMVRGTFANIRLRNRLAPGTEGGCDAAPARRRADDASSTPRGATSTRASR